MRKFEGRSMKWKAHVLFTFLKLTRSMIFSEEAKTIAASIDITNACNLDCVGCYWRDHYDTLSELSNEEWIARIRKIKQHHPAVVHCTWVGGEPMLRRQFLQQGMKEFELNWIVTNGTMPFPNWPHATFWVSIDGTKEYHDQIRIPFDPHDKLGIKKNDGVLPVTLPSMYERTKRNILAAKNQAIYIHTVLNRENWQSAEDLVEEWSQTNVRGIAFSLYTPLPNAEDPLWITWEERDEVIDFLQGVKQKYGSFLQQSKKELELFRSEKAKDVIGDNCLLKKGAVLSLNSEGDRKFPCVMGEMDCYRCGCAIPYQQHAIRRDHDATSGWQRMKTFL